MYECRICYEQVENISFLPCTHSLCFSCKSKLEQKCCPFCRTEFKEEIKKKEIDITNTLPREFLSRYSRVTTFRVKTRRQKRRRTFPEVVQTEFGLVIVELTYFKENKEFNQEKKELKRLRRERARKRNCDRDRKILSHKRLFA